VGNIKLEKLSLRTIADEVKRFGSAMAHLEYSFALGSRLEVSGTVQKVVKRDGQCKLVIEPDSVSGFVVFADCLSDAENIRNHKIRKGSSVAIQGKLISFGARAACLSDCKLYKLAPKKRKRKT
jgi:primosomal replication protein N